MIANARVDGFQFWERERHGFKDELVRSCYLGKVSFATEERSAWSRRWSKRYHGLNAFSSDISILKNRIEPIRIKGSLWTIVELPAVVIAGRDYSLVLTEINNGSTLSWFCPRRRSLCSLGDFGSYLLLRCNEFVWGMIFPAIAVPPASLPFQRHDSNSCGGRYLLNWQASLYQPHLTCALKVVCGVTEYLTRDLRRLQQVA